MNNVKPERWRDVLGYEGLYQVSDCGQVRSMRSLYRIGYTPTGERTYHPRYLRPSWSAAQKPMPCVHLSPTRKIKYIPVLMLEAFVRPARTGERVGYVDGDGTNLALDNLKWIGEGKSNE